MLSGCSGNSVDVATTPTESPTEETAQELTIQEVSTVIKEAAKSSDIPNFDILTDAIATELLNIGVTQIEDTTWEDFVEDVAGGSITMHCTTESKRLDVDCMYVSITSKPTWTILSIENVDSGFTYYIAEGSEKYFDIYDYSTDKIIKEASESIENANPVEDFNKETERIEQEFEENLESLIEKTN